MTKLRVSSLGRAISTWPEATMSRMFTSPRAPRWEGFAGDGAGGTFFFCGEGDEERPVLYADSEGGAALVAIGLPELLRLLLVAPWWRDCQTFTAEESRKLEAEYLEEMPDLVPRRDRAAAALGLALAAEGDVLARLREVALGIGKDFALIFTPEGEPYDPLFEG
ncbi:hypothetical protein [Streptomyces sp. V4I2]|uniref:hypothetical protein n=1 Tax=Streptomyces sp. V4I2 TaxID=3042280 RepID=UPI00277E24B3|nr:hypothetical protein [Streptomyces sp. V4I2]MDQ1051161.1 hypothetical protein [Streptomyces sp. V4I2]